MGLITQLKAAGFSVPPPLPQPTRDQLYPPSGSLADQKTGETWRGRVGKVCNLMSGVDPLSSDDSRTKCRPALGLLAGKLEAKPLSGGLGLRRGQLKWVKVTSVEGFVCDWNVGLWYS